MKKIWKAIIATYLLLIVLVVLSGCSKEEHNWQKWEHTFVMSDLQINYTFEGIDEPIIEYRHAIEGYVSRSSFNMGNEGHLVQGYYVPRLDEWIVAYVMEEVK